MTQTATPATVGTGATVVRSDVPGIRKADRVIGYCRDSAGTVLKLRRGTAEIRVKVATARTSLPLVVRY